MSWCWWTCLPPPHRTTLSRRFKAMPKTIRALLKGLHERFMAEGHSDSSLASVDSSLLHASGNLWHSKAMKAGRLPACGNIDTEAHWGKSGSGEWVFGYRLHTLMVCGPGGLELPYDAHVEAANVKDYEVFKSEFAPNLPKGMQLLLADSGYDEQGCYDACDACEVSLLSPIKVKKNTQPERRERAALFHDPMTREVYALRKTSIEPYQGQLKDLFGLEHLPLKGLANVRALGLLATLAYLLLVSLNLLLGRPPIQLKATLYALR